MSQPNDLEKKLKEPFQRSDIGFRITKVDKTIRKTLVRPVVSSRAVMDRLDDIFGIDGWQVSYTLSDYSVTCSLLIKFGEVWIMKEGLTLFEESFIDHSSIALAKAAVKFGMGRNLSDQPEVIVDIQEKKPENSQSKVHYYQTDNLTGWWEEPDLLKIDLTVENESTEAATVGESDFRKLSLPQKLEQLLALGIITQKKYSDYQAKLEDKATAPGLLRYFEKQFDLLYALHALAIGNKISLDQKATIYKRVMSSKLNGFPAIEAELKSLKEAA